jgi:carbamate kinase
VPQIRSIETLLERGSTVMAAGPAPVTTLPSGLPRGAEAHPDKDAFAALLAEELKADALILLTDVLSEEVNFGKADQQQIKRVTPAMLQAMDLTGFENRRSAASPARCSAKAG